jgi:alcohol dehydrogenase, propanol-preferring
MKADVMEQMKQPVVVEEVQEASLGKDDVVVRVHACGICRTDIRILCGPSRSPPS